MIEDKGAIGKLNSVKWSINGSAPRAFLEAELEGNPWQCQ